MENIFDRFTERAKKVLGLARKEAQDLNHDYIGTEHLLLGLIREGGGVAANVLRNLGVDIERLERRSTEFQKQFFSTAERAHLTSHSNGRWALMQNIIWGAKEAAFKAIKTGLRSDTRWVTCLPALPDDPKPGWHRVTIQWTKGTEGLQPGSYDLPVLRGWWRQHQAFVINLAVRPDNVEDRD